jgi:hypothetical protein
MRDQNLESFSQGMPSRSPSILAPGQWRVKNSASAREFICEQYRRPSQRKTGGAVAGASGKARAASRSGGGGAAGASDPSWVHPCHPSSATIATTSSLFIGVGLARYAAA